MNTFTIKIIAILAMAIDHIGVFIFPQAVFLRALGRLSFPLFAWMIANGAKHTKDINAYLKRLFIFSLLSQIPYTIAFRSIDVSFAQLNIFFTLFLGLLGIKVIRDGKSNLVKIIAVLVYSATAQLIDSDYGMLGVLSIISFYIYFEDIKMMLLSQSAIYFGLLPILVLTKQVAFSMVSIIQPFALISLFFVAFYNGKPGPRVKYLFYVFYPLQYVIFYLLVP